MATWFATSNGNINSAGIWNSLPNGTGSNLTWPAAAGDILMANGRTITINVDTNLGTTGEIRNDNFGGATTAGAFRPATGVSLTANVIAGSSSSDKCYKYSGTGTVFIVGNVKSLGPQAAVWMNSSGIINITGNVVHSPVVTSSPCVQNTSTGTINITGTVNIIGGTTNSYAIDNQAGGTINITGDCTADGGFTSRVVNNNGAGTITITGNVIQTGTSSAGAAYNIAGGTLTISGYVQASTASPGASNLAQGILSVGETRSASNGRPAVQGAFRYASASALIHKSIATDNSVLVMKPINAFILPNENTIRKGVTFGADKIGTLSGVNRHHRMSI